MCCQENLSKFADADNKLEQNLPERERKNVKKKLIKRIRRNWAWSYVSKMENDIELKQAKNLFKSLTKDDNSIFFAAEKITNSL